MIGLLLSLALMFVMFNIGLNLVTNDFKRLLLIPRASPGGTTANMSPIWPRVKPRSRSVPCSATTTS